MKFLAFVLVAVSTTHASVNVVKRDGHHGGCKCPDRDFIAYRRVDADGVGDAVWGAMQARYQTGIQYFRCSLAMDANPAIEPDNDVFSTFDSARCYHADMTELSLTIPDPADPTGPAVTHVVNLQLRSRALPDGVSIEICHCRNSKGGGRCHQSLIEYLRNNSEFRMSDIVVGLTPYYSDSRQLPPPLEGCEPMGQ